MQIEKLLKSGIINLSELSRRLWPHLDKNTARSKLGHKIAGTESDTGRQRLTDQDIEGVREVFREYEGQRGELKR